jgi:hypothetical protein
MNEADRRLFTTWQHIAALASTETDRKRLAGIIDELREALKWYEQDKQAGTKKSA